MNKYGGLWLDATIHVTAPLKDLKNYTYWTPKWVLDSKHRNQYRLWVGLWRNSSVPKLTIMHCMGIWYSVKGNPIFSCLQDFWTDFWRKNDKLPYYWTTDIFLIGCMYDRINSVKQQLDSLENNNPNVFEIYKFINCPVDKIQLMQLMSNTQYFYLRWKSEYYDEDRKSGKSTLFNELKRNPTYLTDLRKTINQNL